MGLVGIIYVVCGGEWGLYVGGAAVTGHIREWWGLCEGLMRMWWDILGAN